METIWVRIRTRVDEFIFYDDIHYESSPFKLYMISR